MIKKLAVLFLVSLSVLSCSKKPSEAQHSINAQPASALPFQIAFVESPESREDHEITRETTNYFETQDYDRLEKLAAKYRESKESYPDGTWKLASVYSALDSPEQHSDAEWEARKKDIEAWIQAKPESVTARITMARFLREFAWKARGSGYADTVSAASWKIFNERLNEATDVLDDAKNLKEKCPVYWSALLWVYLGLQVSKEQYNKTFNEAINEYPDYSYYYCIRAVFLLPRWYGEDGEWEKDLTQAADRIGGEAGDELYAKVVWGVSQYGSLGNIFKENKLLLWERVDRGFAVILKKYPDSLGAKNQRALLAAMAGDKDKARKYFMDTQGRADLTQWSDKGEFMDCVNWAFAQ